VALTLTLDTNCLVDLAEGRPAGEEVMTLVGLHRAGVIDLAITGISASERQQGGGYIRSFNEFRARLSALGVSDLTLLKPMAVVGVAFYDWAVYGSDEWDELRRSITSILFPGLPPYPEYCLANGLDPSAEFDPRYKNRMLDSLILHTHIIYDRDLFISSDDNFHKETKRPRLEALGAKRILTPAQAVDLARVGCSVSAAKAHEDLV
jgi:hypothetical protein